LHGFQQPSRSDRIYKWVRYFCTADRLYPFEAERKTKVSSFTYEMILAFLFAEYDALKSDDTLTMKGLLDRYLIKVIIYGDEFEATFKLLYTHGGGGPTHILCTIPGNILILHN